MARDWYEKQRAGLGLAFVDEVGRTIGVIAMRPLSVPTVHGDTRRAILRRFPYGVFFQVRETEILVLGVIHGRRHPRQWRPA